MKLCVGRIMASSDPSKRTRPGPWPPAQAAPAMPPSTWAKRTGFRPKFSGETNASNSGQIVPRPQDQPQAQAPPRTRGADSSLDLEAGRARPGPEKVNGEQVNEKDHSVRKRRDSDGGGAPKSAVANGQAVAATEPATTAAGGQQPSRRAVRNEEVVDMLPQSIDDDGFARHSHMKYELRDVPGLGELVLGVSRYN